LFLPAGFVPLQVVDVDGEQHVLVETERVPVGCPSCGAVARVKDRRTVTVRDLPVAETPRVLRWRKRVFECRYTLCEAKTWTETHEAIAPRAVLTERARQWAFVQVGGHDRAVSAVAGQLGVAWHTIFTQVKLRGQPLIEDPVRLTGVRALGVDETSFLRATGRHPSVYATGIADLTPGRPPRLSDVVRGRSGAVLGDWLNARDDAWRAAIGTASLDPFRGYATALSTHLPDAVRVLDAFHVVKLALQAVDDIRRRVQQSTTGHRGHRDDPLYRARRILRRRADRMTSKQIARLTAALAAGDPNDELAAGWLVAQGLMAAYANQDRATGRAAAVNLITTAKTCPVPEIAKLGRTLHAWRTEFLARFDHPDVSNGPTENLNLKIKNTKRIARGYRNFNNYRLRLLLNHGLTWQDQQPTRIRTRRPRLAA
jgi:transposase